MAAPVRRRLTAAHGRRFAIGGAVVLGALGAVLYRRGHAVAVLLCAAAVALGALGVLAPTRALSLRAAWIALAIYPARIVQPVVVTAVFLLVVTPMGVLRRTLGRSPLWRDAGAGTFWVRRPPVDPAAARRRMERQF